MGLIIILIPDYLIIERIRMSTLNNTVKQVVIVGGGFAGINAAKALGNQRDVQVSLIDRNNFHLFQPLLYQVASAALSPAEIASPIRGILSRYSNIKVFMGNVNSIDFESKNVLTDTCNHNYDYLILACGSRQSYFGHDDWEVHAPGLKSIEQALDMRRRVLTSLELAECETDPLLRDKYLTFAVIGGGPTGVELAGALAEMTRYSLIKDFRNIDTGQTRIVLLEAGPRVLASFSEELSQHAKQDLTSLGVEVLTGSRVTDITADKIEITGQTIHTNTIMWAAGVQPAKLTNSLGLELTVGGRIGVGTDLSSTKHTNVFVAGDQSGFMTEDQKHLPGTAPVAVQQGQHIAKTILSEIRGGSRNPFVYKDKGQMATIGRNRAVVSTRSFNLKGVLAWWVWLFTHILYLSGFKNRLFVFWDWTWSYLTFERGARIIFTSVLKTQDAGDRDSSVDGQF